VRGRYRQEFFADEYQKLVVDKGRCDLTKRPYHGLITITGFSSNGTRTASKSFLTGETGECLSGGEFEFWLQLHADPTVVHIACQHGLDPRETMKCAMRVGEAHHAFRGRFTIPSTDFVATVKTSAVESFRAYSFKRKADLTRRVLEKARIEGALWKSCGIPFELVLDTDLNRVVIANMKLIFGRHDPKKLACDEMTKNQALAFLTPHVRAGNAALGEICGRCDRELGLLGGTSLPVAYHAIVRRMWAADLEQPILRNRPLALL
jgi:hypothetical protein